MEEGGVCSKHLHRYKWNGFYVESGRMLIRTWQRDYDLVDVTVLEEGDYHKVKPGLYHQFECLESGVAYELYWAEFNHNDIERESVGYHVDEEEDDDNDVSTITLSTSYNQPDVAGGGTTAIFKPDSTTWTFDRDSNGEPYIRL